MESLKLSLLLLSLVILGSAEGKSCYRKRSELKILSGSFKGVSAKAPLVQIMVINYYYKPLKTTSVRSFSPVWNQTLKTKATPRGFTLYARINHKNKLLYICRVKAKKGNGSCSKKRGGTRYRIKYSIRC